MNAVVPFQVAVRTVAPRKSAPNRLSTLGAKPKRPNRRPTAFGDSSDDRHEPISDEPIRFSWTQCLLSVGAYVWLLSSFLRAGLATTSFDSYTSLEPGVYVNIGPYAYGVNTFTRYGTAQELTNITAGSPNELWGYKYDTTSIAMRAFAKFLEVSTFPKGVLYSEKTDPEDILSPATGFAMLDSLVDAVQSNSTSKPRASELTTGESTCDHCRPQTLLLRVSYEFFDRIHHYLFPEIFTVPVWRTCQALHYSAELLQTVANQDTGGNLTDICSMAYGRVRPHFCDELWTHYSRSCRPTKAKCLAVRRVSLHTMQRLAKLKTFYPDATVDLTVFESSRGLEVNRGGIVYVGKRGFDIVTIFRVRTCNSSSQSGICYTQVVDDYRYEGESFTTDALAWYPIVATLRTAAQTYYWIRLIALYFGCYCAVVARTKLSSPPLSKLRKVQLSLMMFFKVPSQVIIYGSSFPLTCYLMAHIIDSTIVYDMLAQKFDTINGLFHLNIWDLVTISSVQMRNVWVLAGCAHIAVRVATQRRWWSPLQGVWGMPQFSIVIISSLTIISQFRYKSLRYTPVRSIQLVNTVSRLHPTLEAQLGLNGGAGKANLEGIFMDIKAVVCSVIILLFVGGIMRLVLKYACPRWDIRLVFWRSYSYTPLSAGIVWPTALLAVSWNDDVFQFSRVERVLRSSALAKTHPVRALGLSSRGLLISMKEIQSLDDRPRSAETVAYLMNATMLSDPIVFLTWRWNSSTTLLRYCRSRKTNRVYLVPATYTIYHSELSWEHFTFEKTVAASELSWSELITCG